MFVHSGKEFRLRMHRAALTTRGNTADHVTVSLMAPFLSPCIGVHPPLNLLPALALFHPSGTEPSNIAFRLLNGAIIPGHRLSVGHRLNVASAQNRCPRELALPIFLGHPALLRRAGNAREPGVQLAPSLASRSRGSTNRR
jgi:hypothetical protein